MKDLIAKLKSEANVALGAIWLHIDAQSARIAELESEVTRLSASWRGDATVADALEERIAELEAQIDAAPVPVVEEKDLWALLPNSAWYLDPPDGGNVSLLEQLQRMSKDAAAYRSTALQAPVREVPEWISVEDRLPDSDPDKRVWATWSGAGNIELGACQGEARFVASMGWQPIGHMGWDWNVSHWQPLPALPAAPVQEPKP